MHHDPRRSTMNVERLKKINSLAQELLKHNFALDPSDAFKQAENIYTQQEHQTSTVQPTPPPSTPEQPVPSTPPDTELLEKKYQLLISMSTKQFETEIAALKTQVQTLAEDIRKIRVEMASARTLPEQKTDVKEEKAPEQAAPKPEEKKPEHPRQGQYTSQDVAIDKMFYFGNKR